MTFIALLKLMALLIANLKTQQSQEQPIYIHHGKGYIHSRPFRYAKHGGIIRAPKNRRNIHAT